MASAIPSLRVSPRDNVCLEGGILVLGAISSGKTSATAAMILRRLLADPRTGMLLLTAHPEEVARILGYIRDAGREQDLLLFSRHRFNALEWGRRLGYSVEGLTALVMHSMEVSGRVERSAPHAQDNWLASMQSLVRAAIQLIALGQDFLSLYDIHRVLLSAPADARDPHRPSWQQEFCHQLIVQARQRVARLGHPLAQHDLRMVEDYFLRFWATLNPRTKTTMVSVFQAFASPFLYGELYQRCCTGLSIDPRATHGGKIILMDTPAEFSESNLVMQTMMKNCWQLATRRRRLTPQSGLALCYADEAALYTTSGDGPFLAIARNRKASMAYIGHAIPEFAEKIGRNAAMNLFSHFRTKIFHATNDPETAQYAAVGLIGETWQPQLTRTRTESHMASGAMSLLWNEAIRLLARCYSFSWGTSVSVTDRLAPQILPHDLATLRTGGKAHRFLVDVIIVQSGTTWSNGCNFLRATLRQDLSQPRHSLLSLLGG